MKLKLYDQSTQMVYQCIWWLWKHYDDDGEAYKVYPMRRNVGLKSEACIIGCAGREFVII